MMAENVVESLVVNDAQNDRNADADNAAPADAEQADAPRAKNIRNRRPRNTANNATNIFSAQRHFEGATPAIGGVLALQSENVNKKLSYDRFKERLETYVMKKISGREHVIKGIKHEGERC